MRGYERRVVTVLYDMFSCQPGNIYTSMFWFWHVS
jgi:hypothetical protein